MKSPIKNDKTKSQPSGQFTNLGGTGDCGFRSIAGGVLDLFLRGELNRQFAANQYKQLLEEYFKTYPMHLPAQAQKMTDAEKMSYLYHTVHKQDLTSFSIAMGYVIRQMAVSEICANVEDYPGAFVTKNEGTSPQQMRQQNTWIDETAIAAAAKVLDLPITVVANDGGQITRTYNENNSSPITIQLQRKHYIPWISNEALKQQPKQVALQTVTPVKQDYKDPTQAECQSKLEEDRIAKALEKNIQNQLSQKDSKDLLNLFIKYQHSNDFLEGYTAKYIDPEFKQFLDNADSNPELVEFFKPLLVQKLSLAVVHKYVPQQEVNNLKASAFDKVNFFTEKTGVNKAANVKVNAEVNVEVANPLPSLALTS